MKLENSNYYTNINVLGNNICFRGIRNGKRVSSKLNYEPHLYVKTDSESEYKTIYKENLKRIDFTNIKDAKDFIYTYRNVENFEIYGNQSFEYAFIADKYKSEIEWNIDDLRIFIIDIETYSNEGFPDPEKAEHPITAITIRLLRNKSITFACGDYESKSSDTQYIRCSNEFDLIEKFIEFWSYDYPDIITGWNIQGFDVPYLFNRLRKIFSESFAKKLSPWNVINRKQKFTKTTGKEYYVYEIYGISIIDYLDLYKQFALVKHESYRLDFVCNYELKTGKINYDEFDSLHQLYVNDFIKFIDYNIRDCELIEMLEDKLRLLELTATLAYDTKSFFEDVFTQTRMWDAIIYNHLLNKHIIIPDKEISSKDGKFEGAFVKNPILGKYTNVISFDLESLYPSLIEQYNLSPDTLINPENYTDEMKQIISNGVSVQKLLDMNIDLSKLNNVVLTPNGQFFRTDFQGFLSEIVSKMKYDRKVKYKNLMLETQRKLELLREGDKLSVEEEKSLNSRISKYKILQLAKKVQANAGFGTLGSIYFRFFDIRIAEAITLSGQLTIKWIENHINTIFNKLLKSNSKDFVIYADTDSVFLNLNDIVSKKNFDPKDISGRIDFLNTFSDEFLHPYIQKSYKKMFDYIGGCENILFMKREKICSDAIITGKKHYILKVYDNEGVRYKEPENVIVGLDMIKSSTPSIIREKMKEVVEILLSETEDKLQKFIIDFEKKFLLLSPEDIAFPRGVNGIKEYADSISIYKKGSPIHVRGSLIFNDQIKKHKVENKYQSIKDGDKIKFIYLKEPNKIRDNVISFINKLPSEFDLNSSIDYNLMFDKVFISSIKNITDHIGWSVRKENNLLNFFQ